MSAFVRHVYFCSLLLSKLLLFDMFTFVKESIRKLSDLNTVRGNNTRFNY